MRRLLETHPDSEIQAYIDQACAGIPSSRRKQDAQRELLSHVLEIERELGGSNFPSRQQLNAEILIRLGDPMELQKLLAQANRSSLWKKIGYLGSLSVLLALSTSVFWVAQQYDRALDNVEGHAKTVEVHFNELAQLQEMLGSHPFFAPADKGLDAGPLLNTELQLSGPRNSLKSKALVPDELRKHLPSLDTQDWEEVLNLDLGDLDLTWMRHLAQYSYWDLDANNPAAQNALAGPRVADLLSLAKARLVEGFQKKDLKNALQDVSHLARLLYSTNTLISSYIAISLLKMALHADQYGMAHGLIRPTDWSTFSEEKLQQLRQATAQMAFVVTGVTTPPAVLQKIADHPQWVVGLCAGLHEGVLAQSVAKAFFNKTWAYELDINPTIQARQRLIEANRGRCRLDLVEEKSAQFADDLSLNLGDRRPFPFEQLILKLESHTPYLRRVVGLQLADLLQIQNPFTP